MARRMLGDDIPKTIVKRFDTLTGVTITGGATAIVTRVNGADVLRVTTLAGTQCEVQVACNIPAPQNRHVVCAYSLLDYTTVDQLHLFYGSAGYAGWIQTTATLSGVDIFSRNGYNTLDIHDGNIATNGAGFNLDTGTAAASKFRINPKVGQVVVIDLHSIFTIKRRRSAIVIGFDDNRPSITTVTAAGVNLKGVVGSYTFKNILDEYGFPGTLWVVSGYLNSSVADIGGTISWSEIIELKDLGWDIQAQTHANPVDANTGGSRLLGSYGYNRPAVLSVDTAANTLTTASAHNIVNTYSYPIFFTGTDLPSPLLAYTRYYARGTLNVFTLHPTAQDGVAGTNTIDITSVGVAANFVYHYWGSEIGSAAILRDYDYHNDYIEREIGVRPRFVATNQGAYDSEVKQAVANAGYLAARLTYNSALCSSYLLDEQTELDCGPMSHNIAYPIDEAVARTEDYYYQSMLPYIKSGLVIHTYCHDSNTTTNQNLANFCSAADRFKKLGLVDVLTMTEWYNMSKVRLIE